MIPRKFAPILFGLILSGLMSFIVSGIATFRAAGLAPNFTSLWLSGWVAAWLVAFPVVLFVAPLTRKVVERLTG